MAPVDSRIMSDLFTSDIGSKALRKLLSVNNECVSQEHVSELHVAAFSGVLTRVKKLLQAGADVNARIAPHGYTPIAGAATENHANVVKALIRGGADVNLTFDDGYSTLCLVTEVGHRDVICILFENGADISFQIKNTCDSLLHIAALNGHSDVVIFLIDNGLDVNTINKANMTPLHHAAKSGHTTVIEILIEKGAHIDAKADSDGGSFNVSPLFMAVQNRHLDATKALLKAGADANTEAYSGMTCLHLACSEGYPEIVVALLGLCDVNVKDLLGFTPLHYASDFGHLDVVSILLGSKEVAVNSSTSKKVSPLHLAALKGHCGIAKALIAKEADINVKDTSGSTPLHVALQHCNVDICSFFLKRGADVNASNKQNWIPLHEACYSGVSPALVKDLIFKGSNVNALSIDGKTASFLAAEQNHLDILKALIINGVDLNTSDAKGRNPLHIAASNGNLEVVEFLVDEVQDIDAITISHSTALHAAVEFNHLKVAEILLQKGANVNAQDCNLSTPLHLATSKGFIKLSKLLLNYDQNLTLTDKNKRTPLHFAAQHLPSVIVKMMLQLGADINARMDQDRTPLHSASERGRIEVVKTLLISGAYYDAKALDLSSSSSTLTSGLILPIDLARNNNKTTVVKLLELVENLFAATIKNDVNKMKDCVGQGAIVNSIDSSGKTPFNYAVSNSNLNAVKVLIDHHAGVFTATSSGRTLLHSAVSEDRVDILDALLNCAKQKCFLQFSNYINSQTSKKGYTALHIAAEKNNLDASTRLLKYGAIHNLTDSQSKTPLQLTTHPSIIDLLNSIDIAFQEIFLNGYEEAMEFDVNEALVNCRDSTCDSRTLLICSIVNGHSDNAVSFLENGADYTLVDCDGKSPLFMASAKGNSEVLKALLAHGKEYDPRRLTDLINYPTVADGAVALHVASNVKVAEMLLRHGAVFNFKNKDGKIPADVTKSIGVKQLLEFVQGLFEDAQKGNPEVSNKIRGIVQLEPLRFGAVINAHNAHGDTLFQVLDSQINSTSKKKKKDFRGKVSVNSPDEILKS